MRNPLRQLLPLVSSLVFGCAPSVIGDFERAREAALSDPGPAPAQWEADAILSLSHLLVDESLQQLLEVHGRVDGELDAGLLKARPAVVVERVTLAPARCTPCLRVEADLGGHLKVQTPLADVKVPLTGEMDLDAVFGLVPHDDGWTLTIAPKQVREISVDLGGADFGPLTRPLSAWLGDALADTEPLALADLGSSNLPIRAMKVLPQGRDLRLELLTRTPDPVAVLEPDELPEHGWRLDLATDTLLDLARSAAFQARPLPRDIVAEPTSLMLTDDRFDLGLRLWRIKGRGWWRDYTITGSIQVVDSKIELTPDEVEDGAHSQGAAWADPLAALAQGVILKALERALETSVPAVHRDKGDALRVVVTIDDIEGRGAVAVAHGGLKITKPKR